MKKRVDIIRRVLPVELKELIAGVDAPLGIFSNDLSLEESDGIGRKTEAPWVRVYSRAKSPSAREDMGFIQDQAVSSRCEVTDYAKL